ncbi:MAG TPA: ribonuclease HI [Salinisphaeraceae bacterium]|nr:ribonuclease HI [Salinisphaeraceae bacterium]
MSKSVVIYTDGACRGNPGPGGWGALLRYGNKTRELYGAAEQTTNNRMELTAAIRALEALQRACRVELYTDSNYLRQGITQWLPRWQRNGWRTSAKKPVKNADLWQRLHTACAQDEIAWHWVKGHSGDPGNEAVDALANRGIDELQQNAS